MHRLAHAERALVGLLLSRDHAEERGLARAVGADDADDAAARQAEAQVLDQEPVAVPLEEVLGLHDHVAQARPRRDDDLRRAVALLASLGQQRLVGLEPRLGLGLARAGGHAHPLELVLERALARRLLLLLLGQALLLLIEPRGVVALPRDARAAVELEDPPGDVVEEVAVMGDGHARDLASRERGHVGIAGGAAQGVHRDLHGAVEIPTVGGLDRVLHPRLLLEDFLHLRRIHRLAESDVDLVEAREEPAHFGHAVLHVAAHVLRGVEVRLLRQVAGAHAIGGLGLAQEVLVHPCHDLEQGALARAVRTEDADLGAGVKRQPDALEDLALRGNDLPQVLHRENELVGHKVWIIPGVLWFSLTNHPCPLYKQAPTHACSGAMTPPANPSILAVRDLSMRFGGIVALDEVSFEMEAGQIVGLIGPNGAGKTTLFNCLGRLYTPQQGDILFEGQSIIAAPTHHIAELGIGRTFQNLALFPTMSVLDNVLVGVHSRTRSDFASNALKLPWVGREERLARETARELIAFLDLEDVSGHPAAGLPFGTLKRVELARALANRPRLLLLDEPAGGLNHEEVAVVGTLVRAIRDERRITVLLVEHHMSLVMQVSDKVVVLDFGRKIAEGPPAEIQRNRDVIKAYLGSEN